MDALLTSYPAGSSPPFRGAILESGQISFGPTAQFASSVGAWNQLSKALGCPGRYSSDLACVRAAPATEIRRIIDVDALDFNPVPDGVTLVSNPAALREAGKIANIPCMGGTNAQEGRVFVVGQNNTAVYLEGLLGNASTPAIIRAFEAAYPIGSPVSESTFNILLAGSLCGKASARTRG